MKNGKFFLFLAAFMVAIACGGNPTDGQDPNLNPNPDPNMGCEPNCPVDVQTVTRGLISPTSGDFINLNGTRVVDSERRPILTAGETMVMIQIPTRGPTPNLNIIDRQDDGTDGRLLASSSGRNFMPEMSGDPISLWYWVYGGDWYVDDGGNAASEEWYDGEVSSPVDGGCPTGEQGWGSETTRITTGIGNLSFSSFCNHDDGKVSFCACRDQDGDGTPNQCQGCERFDAQVVVWGQRVLQENRLECIEIKVKSLRLNEIFENRACRLAPN